MTGKQEKPPKTRRNLGIWGENIAAEFLVEHGYKILGKNLRTSYGEIDIAASKNGVLVFVEVKTRRTMTYGYPEESITPGKQEHMINSAKEFLLSQAENDVEWQIDVISIDVTKSDSHNILHFENAISE